MSPILLVQPPIEDFYLTAKRTLPYGLAAIAGSLRHHGFKTEILDCLATRKTRQLDRPKAFDYLSPYFGRFDGSAFSLFHTFRHFGYSFEHIGRVAKETKPFLTGISSLFTPYADTALKAAAQVKKSWPSCKIVLGGHHPTHLPAEVMACPDVDYVIRGEGEIPLPLLAEAVRDNTGISGIPGIVFRKDDGTLHISDPYFAENLDQYPEPALDLVHPDFYRRRKKKAVMVVSSRGCPMTCTYCAVSARSGHIPYRRRRPHDVIRELEIQAASGDIGFIDFEDENLCLEKSWFISLMQDLMKLFVPGSIELRAMNGLYPPSIDRDVATIMKQAGFRTLNLSLGSASANQMKRFGRKVTTGALENAIGLARSLKLECVSYIIAGAPGQDPFESLDDLLYLAALPTLAGLSVFYPAPGSHDYLACQKRGLLPSDFSLMRSTALPISDTTNRRQAVTLLRLSRILNFMKSCIELKLDVTSEKFKPSANISHMDRASASLQLLRWFMHDGIIRGFDRDGVVFDHDCDLSLTRCFVKKIRKNNVLAAG